ncbi:M14 family metallopeptidase [Actinocorallia lasiicapitis]
MTSIVAAVTLGSGLLVAAHATTAAAAPDGADQLQVFTGEVTPEQLQKIRDVGLDHEDIATAPAVGGKSKVEVVMSGDQGAKLVAKGVPLQVKVAGKAKSKAKALAAGVYRPYSGDGGIHEEIVQAAADHPAIAKSFDIGTTVNGKPITAVRVTKDAATLPDKARPAVVFQAAQHAREWITTENVRRQLHYFLDGYGTNAEITSLIDTTDLYFIPVVNVDGYDKTFEPGFRLWRKNLRDNNGDGQITAGDGVDPNRNFPYKWGYDNEGSSPSPDSETYRGTAAGSEPETQAQLNFVDRVRPKFVVNYHSAAQLLLYGVGWQTATPSPDDHVFETILGDDDHPAVPGYDPDLGAELYTTNGETDGHFDNNFGALTMTPEMSTCQTASDINPDDQWNAADCESVFNFPDDEGLIQAEFAKNVPMALSVAKSAQTPDAPVSSIGRTAPDFVVDKFPVSYGHKQPIAVDAKRSLTDLKLRYRINGASPRVGEVTQWQGGERYGKEGTHYYGEFRGQVKGDPGDSVEVWFEGKKAGAAVASEHFTYTVANTTGAKVLVLADEDVTGVSPAQGGTTAKHASTYTKAIKDAGYTADVYDIDANNRKAPHPLGVLSHYKAVVWETGDNIITRAVGQPGGTAAKLALDTELSVRDYLNEGGKLLYAGKYAGYASAGDGVYWYDPDVATGAPECSQRTDPPCLPLLNDFLQYYLGAYTYVDGGGSDPDGNPFAVKGSDGRFAGFSSPLNGGDGADNQDHTGSFLTTSSFLPPAQFPQFASSAPIKWNRPGGAPFDPKTGTYYAYTGRADVSYKRLTTTVDLTGKTDGNLKFQTSYDTEAGWDHMIVEAHTVGQDDWTTLPDLNGHTTQETGDSCASGWRTIHPFTEHYQGADCSPTGTTGAWNAASGPSNGWQEWSIDLTAYAGKQVELSISYVSDWGTQQLGVFVDDAVVTSGGATLSSTSFEDGLGGWTVSGPPAGSGQNGNDWTRSTTAFTEGAGVVTADTVYTGFGIEGFPTAEARASFVRRSLKHLFE